MVALAAVAAFFRTTLDDWRTLRLADLRFQHGNDARLALLVLGGVCIAVLVLRAALGSRPGRDRVLLPAVPPWLRGSRFSAGRHGAMLLFLAGIPFFAIALADPHTRLTRDEVSYPGRRIALMIDASSSMVAPFKAARLNAHAPADMSFFTSVAAAESFIRLRIQGKYHDLMSLIEFGDEAYVITPFTADYENILLSVSLISDATEWGAFPDKGTTIAQAIDQAISIFRAFDFLNAAGNLMVIISDGQDSEVSVHGRSLADILHGAVEAKIPVYFIRVSYNRELGAIIPDEIWREAVERTGGRFFAASDEATIYRAIQEIDRVGAGKIAVTQYSTERSRFSPYAAVASVLWTLALALKLTMPYFSKFP